MAGARGSEKLIDRPLWVEFVLVAFVSQVFSDPRKEDPAYIYADFAHHHCPPEEEYYVEFKPTDSYQTACLYA